MTLRIELKENTLVIEKAKSCLHPVQLAQIRFWGFQPQETGQNSDYMAQLDVAILPKLLDYFDQEHVTYELGHTCEKVRLELSTRTLKLQGLFDNARNFKAGVTDKKTFSEFVRLVDSFTARPLKEHQYKAAFHLSIIGNGANFSVPGSGKTAVVLSCYEALHRRGEVSLLVVVGPPSCFKPWIDEFRKTLGRQPTFRTFAGGDKLERKASYYKTPEASGELCLITYQTLLMDQQELSFMLNQPSIQPYLVIDEAHYIKQLNGNWATAVLGIAALAKYRCVLTGTPMPRSYADLFNLFDFLWLEQNPLSGAVKIELEQHERNDHQETAKQLLRDVVGPLFYRVPKSELGLSEPILHPPQIVNMNRYERIIYDAISSRIRHYAKQDYLRNVDFVWRLWRGRIMRLRQCASYTGLLSNTIDGYQEDLLEGELDLARLVRQYDELEIPAKLTQLVVMVKEFEGLGEKVLIWSNFVGTLKLIERHLIKSCHACKLIYGATPSEVEDSEELETRQSRQSIIAEFLDLNSGMNVLIANPAACAESISLHRSCHRAIYYDLSYNCAQYLQSLDRIHRVGGSETVQPHYHFLQYADTIDLDIKANLESKAQRMYSIIDSADVAVLSLDMFDEADELKAYERLFGSPEK